MKVHLPVSFLLWAYGRLLANRKRGGGRKRKGKKKKRNKGRKTKKRKEIRVALHQ